MRRRVHSQGLLAGCFIAAAALHPALGAVYELSREQPRPRLFVEIDGEGLGLVQSVPAGIRCGDDCNMRVDRGDLVRLVAAPGVGSTFEGWTGPCGPQRHKLFEWGYNVTASIATEKDLDESSEFFDYLGRASAPPPPPAWPLECVVHLEESSHVRATFGQMPDELEVAWIDVPADAGADEVASAAGDFSVELPDPAFEAENLFEPEELQELPQLAELTPPPPPPPPPVQDKQEEKKKEELEKQNLKSVEVPDENEVEEAPDDARFLSDKNRDVAEETRATETNLERQADGDRAFSEKSDVVADNIGAEEEKIAALEETESTTLSPVREKESAHSGEAVAAKGIVAGEEGEGGQQGEDGDGSEAESKGMLAMRGVDGRGAPGGPSATEIEEEGAGETKVRGTGGKEGRSGDSGTPGLRLEQEDYERIVGTDVAESERQLAAREMSKRRGRWERKLGAIQSSLENFTPEVRPGNQTALKTRAAPFAVYISRMHRRIHELWGFGFLEDLDRKSSGHELNNWTLVTKIEIVINPDGTVDKMTIVKPSGVLPFDVAAMDVIYTSGPFEPPPEKIRSKDGKTYMHWSFHRDWRQCGTFGVQPFILDNPSGARDTGMSDADLLDAAGRRQRKAPAVVEQGSPAAAARAASNVPAPDDPEAQHVANLWLSGYAAGNVSKLVSVTSAPFRSGGAVVASSSSEIGSVYRTILKESGGQRIRGWKVLSAAGYRRAVGALPEGVSDTATALFLVVQLGDGERLTLVLTHMGRGYRVTGIER